MYEFLEYVLSLLGRGLLLAGLAAVAGGIVLAVVYGVFRKRYGKTKPFPWGKTVVWFLVAGYLAVLGYATLLRQSWGVREVSFHPLRAWMEAWNDFSFKSWANVLLNVALFVPAGFLLPLLWEKLRKWKRAIPAGFGLSLAVELAQLALARGVCDVDDLIANTLGAALGFFLVMALLGFRNRRQFFRFAGMTLALLAVLALPFGIYGLQTYGNLPDAPAYRLNTSATQWSLGCQLPQSPETATVYHKEPKSRQECAQMAAFFASLENTEVGVESYYQEMAYYNLKYGGILQVFYHDGSWEYLSSAHWDSSDGVTWPNWNREQVEAALEPYPLTIPEEAEFVAEGEGWYSFSCDESLLSGAFWDGTLRCRFTPTGEVREIIAKLNSFAYHSEAEILTAEEAWKKLQKGWFKDDLGYQYHTPTQVTATECALSYTADTKGFYQPVWEFQLTSNNGFGGTVMIPAVG